MNATTQAQGWVRVVFVPHGIHADHNLWYLSRHRETRVQHAVGVISVSKEQGAALTRLYVHRRAPIERKEARLAAHETVGGRIGEIQEHAETRVYTDPPADHE